MNHTIKDIMKEAHRTVRERGLSGNDAVHLFELACHNAIIHEELLIKKVDLLRAAVRLGNNLFDYFSDIFIDDAVSKSVQSELKELHTYLVGISRIFPAPMSSNMLIIRTDRILEGLLDE